jgi:hypothetical protein
MTHAFQFKKTVVPVKAAATNNGDETPIELEAVVIRINPEELKEAVQNSIVLVDLLHRHKAPAAIFRIRDDEPRKLHANVRAAYEAILAAPDGDALANSLRVASGLSKKAPLIDCLLYLLGSYDLRKGPDGRAIDAFFWSRDRGDQAYFEKHNIRSTDVVAKLADLGGVHNAYTIWCAEKKGLPRAVRKKHRTFEEAVRDAIPDLKVGDRICVEAEVNKSNKFEFIGIHKCNSEVDSEIVADRTDQRTFAPGDCSVRPAALIGAPVC